MTVASISPLQNPHPPDQNSPPSKNEYKKLLDSIKDRNFEQFESILNKNEGLLKEKPHILDYFLNNVTKNEFKFVKLLINTRHDFYYPSFSNYFVKSHLSEDEMLELIDILIDLGKTDIVLGATGVTQNLFESLNFTQNKYHTTHALSQTYSKVFNRLFQLGGCSHEVHPFRKLFEKQDKPISSSNLKTFTDQLDLTVKDPEGRTWITSIMDRCQPNDFELLLVVRNLIKSGAEVPDLNKEHPWFTFLRGLSGSDLDFVEMSLPIIDPNQTVTGMRNNAWGHPAPKFKEMPRQYPKLQEIIKALPLAEFGKLIFSNEGEKFFKILPLPLLAQKLKEILPKSTEEKRRTIFELVSKLGPPALLIKLVTVALEKKVNPLSKLTDRDPRSLLQVLIDGSTTRDFTSDLQPLWRYIMLPSDQLREHFPQGSFLAYKLEQSLQFSQKSLFKFALQSTSLPHEDFLPDINIPEKRTSSNGSTCKKIYPYITVYLEEFLSGLEDKCLDDLAIKEILQVFLFNSANSNVKMSHSQLSLFQTHGFTFIPSGFYEHSFPIVFFKINKTTLRAIPNRGGGAFSKSLSIHSLNTLSMTAEELRNVRRFSKKSEQESLNYFYLTSLHKHQATGTETLHRIFQEQFSKKPQLIGNCTTVGGKAAVELILSASKLQRIPEGNSQNEAFMEQLEGILSSTNKQYKWFSLFTSLASLHDLYKNANRNKIFFDPKAEELMMAKIQKKFEKLTERFGMPSKVVLNKLECVREQSKTFKIKVSEITRPAVKETIPPQAIKEGNIKRVKDWIATGDELFTHDTKGNSALHLAISNDQTEVALLLIDKGIELSSLNSEKEYPLLIAIAKRNKVITKKLLEVTRPESYKRYRRDPLEVAFRTKDKELIEQFMHAGFNSAAMLQVNSIFKNKELFENCLQKGLDINAKNPNEKTLFDTVFEDFLTEIDPQNVEQGKFLENQTPILEKLSYLKSKGLQWTTSMAEKVFENYQGLLSDSSPIARFLKANSQSS